LLILVRDHLHADGHVVTLLLASFSIGVAPGPCCAHACCAAASRLGLFH